MAELPPSLKKELDHLHGLQRRTRAQKERMRILELAEQEYRSRIQPYETHPLGTNEPAPKYKPLLTYPKFNTRVNPLTDVLYSEPPSKNINASIDYEWIIRNNPAVREAFPKGPLEMSTHYVKRVTRELQARKQNLDLLNQGIAYNPNPMEGYFASRKADPNQRMYTTLDIETDDYGRPISISASRLQWDNKMHTFVAVDSMQRFYLARNQDLLGTFDVHGMTSAKLLSLRDQQKAHYSTKYNEKEQQALLNYIGNSIIIGHNIVDFDLNRLFPNIDINNSTIDTLKLARSVWNGKENALHNVFYRLYGKKMEDMGLSHHDPNADTIASAMIAAKMFGAKGLVGASLRYIRESVDPAHIAEWDSMMDSMVTKGTFRDMYSRDLYEVFMSRDEIIRDVNGDPIGRKGELGDAGIHTYEELLDADGRAGLQVVVEQIKVLSEDLKNVHQQMGELGKGVGHGIPALSNELAEAYNQYNNYKRMSLVKDISHAIGEEEIDTLIKSSGIKLEGPEREEIIGWGTRLRKIKEKDEESKFKQAKEHRLERFEKYNHLSKADKAAIRATKTYEELADAIEDVTKKNQGLMKVYQAFADIKPYDVNQYIASAKKQWGGIMGASQGVVPNFIRNPVSRLGDAFFNAVDRSVSPWNAFNRTWNSGIGQAITGGLGAAFGLPGMMIGGTLSGVVNAGSQIYGNYKQAHAEMNMLNIQNNLNTLGAMISWISTPFQLLHKAIKLVTGAFGGLTFKLNSIMGNGINSMSQLGNPLEQMTGVGYSEYQGLGLVDMASLLKGGSTNAAIEDLAIMQRDLYRYGKVDTEKMLAANMLGVFEEAYTPTTDTTSSYFTMANKILRRMQGMNGTERTNMLYYANKISPTLAQTIRSADLLGVTDIRQLEEPDATGNKMYWRKLSEGTNGEEGAFRRTQYEYNIAKQQFGFSKMRIADKLWNAIGRDTYNGINEVIDKLQAGNWKDAWESIKTSWEKLKNQFLKIWEGDGEEGTSLKDRVGKGLETAWDKIKDWGLTIANGIIDIWDQIFRAVLEKSQGLIAYLSTVQVGFEKDKKTGKWGVTLTSIKDATDGGRNVYSGSANSWTGEYYVEGANKGMEGYAALVDALFPDMTDWEKQFLTRETLTEKLKHLPGIIKDGVLTTPSFDLPQYHLHGLNLGENPELIEPLLDYLTMYESQGTGMRGQAAAMLSPLLKPYLDEGATHTPLLDMYDKMIEGGRDVRNTVVQQYMSEGSRKLEADINVNVGDKNVGTVKVRNGGLTFDGFRPLSSMGYNKGIEVSSTKVSGGN